MYHAGIRKKKSTFSPAFPLFYLQQSACSFFLLFTPIPQLETTQTFPIDLQNEVECGCNRKLKSKN
jgi:hypothetical protein